MRRSGSYFPVWAIETTAVDRYVSGVIPGAQVSPKFIFFLEVGKNFPFSCVPVVTYIQ